MLLYMWLYMLLYVLLYVLLYMLLYKHLHCHLLPLLQTELLRVDVETCSPLSAGQTVVDIWHQSTQQKNCTVCMVSCALAGWWGGPDGGRLMAPEQPAENCTVCMLCCGTVGSPCPHSLHHTAHLQPHPTHLRTHATYTPQGMDVARFWDLLVDAIHAADRQSPLNSSGGSGRPAADAAAVTPH